MVSASKDGEVKIWSLSPISLLNKFSVNKEARISVFVDQGKKIFIAEGELKLSDMSYFSKDPDGYQKLADKVSAAQSDKAVKEEQWLEIELKREALETEAKD